MISKNVFATEGTLQYDPTLRPYITTLHYDPTLRLYQMMYPQSRPQFLFHTGAE